MNISQALAFADSNREAFVEQLETYLRFPSVSAQSTCRPALLECASWLKNHCQELGLKTKLIKTAGHPVLLASTRSFQSRKSQHKRQYLVYGHYDVQPADPLELWDTPPFEPTIRKGQIFARGSSDNKGQNFAHLKGLQSLLAAGVDLPFDVTFVLEGEEEVGSEGLSEVLKKHRELLQCEGVIVSDTGMPAEGLPALTYGLRGVVACEVKVTGPSRDMHSGIYGGSVENPAMALAQLLAGLRDKDGRITVEGFYDEVKALAPFERKAMARLPHSDRAYAKFLGVKELAGEAGYTAHERRSCRPTLEINGLTSGYQGEGSKTIVPSWASAKITCRLVPNQKPATILRRLKRHLKAACPKSVRLEVMDGHGGEAYMVDPRGPKAKAALRALEQAFGCKPLMLREGGSIPIVSEFKKVLKADTLLLGIGLPDDNIHSPNEKFSLDCFHNGIRMGIHLWKELADLTSK